MALPLTGEADNASAAVAIMPTSPVAASLTFRMALLTTTTTMAMTATTTSAVVAVTIGMTSLLTMAIGRSAAPLS